MPDFLIIGTPRGGTTSLMYTLSRHPCILAPPVKEIGFFDMLYDRGVRYYRSFFPLEWRKQRVQRKTGARCLTGEATPTYLYGGPAVVQRVREVLPNVKLIVVIRNPVDRAYSHYWALVRRGLEPLPFEEALEQEEVRLEQDMKRGTWRLPPIRAYRGAGVYAEPLADWIAGFPSEQLLVLHDDDLHNDPETAFERIWSFLGVKGGQINKLPRLNAKPAPPMNPETRLRLERWFEPHNERLYHLTGIRLSRAPKSEEDGRLALTPASQQSP